MRVVAGLKIWPSKMGRPSASDADLLAGQERAEVAGLERVDGRRVAEALSVPERKRVQSALTKKNVLFLMMGPPSVAPQFLLSSGVFGP